MPISTPLIDRVTCTGGRLRHSPIPRAANMHRPATSHSWMRRSRAYREGDMSFADDHAVRSTGLVFHHSQHAVPERFARVHENVRLAVEQLHDDDALALDPDAWARQLASDLEVQAPSVDVDRHDFISEGRVKVDCTGWPGVSYSLTEYGSSVLRDGHRFRVTVPGEGELELLQSRLNRGGTGRRVDIHRSTITRVYEWPEVLAADQLQDDVDTFLTDLQQGAAEISEQIAQRNTELVDVARRSVAERQQRIRDSRAYLGDLRLTVTRDPGADTTIPVLPQPIPGPGAADTGPGRHARPASATTGSQLEARRIHRPTLDEFYDHVVNVVGAVAVGFERSARRFAQAEEETLRDFILVTLNSHYEGAATGETFNATGKTDILVRHGMDNAFVGECKFWAGKAMLERTFEQLLGYTTWQDNRLALILFVRTKKLQPVLETARGVLGSRPEFRSWQPGAPDGQLRCRLRWEDPARKEGRLTAFFIHLPA